jgi:hypothetical protein
MEQLLAIAEAAFPADDKKIDSVMPSALDAITSLAKLGDTKWKPSLVRRVLTNPCLSSSYRFVLEKSPADISLLSSGATSYSQFISATPQTAEVDGQTAKAFLDLLGKKEMLIALLLAMMRNFDTAADPSVLLRFCLLSAQFYREISEDVQLDLHGFIVTIIQFAIINSPSRPLKTIVHSPAIF